MFYILLIVVIVWMVCADNKKNELEREFGRRGFTRIFPDCDAFQYKGPDGNNYYGPHKTFKELAATYKQYPVLAT